MKSYAVVDGVGVESEFRDQEDIEEEMVEEGLKKRSEDVEESLEKRKSTNRVSRSLRLRFAYHLRSFATSLTSKGRRSRAHLVLFGFRPRSPNNLDARKVIVGSR